MQRGLVVLQAARDVFACGRQRQHEEQQPGALGVNDQHVRHDTRDLRHDHDGYYDGYYDYYDYDGCYDYDGYYITTQAAWRGGAKRGVG